MTSRKKQIQDTEILKKYLETCQIQQMFDTDISSKAALFSFPKHSCLISAGEISGYLYILVSGEVKVCSYTNGDRVLYNNYLIAPQLLGEGFSLFNGTPVTSVEACTDCLCIGFSLKKYRSMFLNDNRFLRNVCFTLLNRGNFSFCNSLLDPLEMRLASFILKYQDNGRLHFNISQCSQLLNSSYRHLYRLIKSLCENKVLMKSSGGYRIMDPEYLSELATGRQSLK
ncbi:cyclic nucleotide-binding domain-containing protein [Lachnospiraceae bacterium 54-53]